MFFQTNEIKSTKSIIIFRTVIAILMAVLLITAIIKEFDLIFLKLFFILAGIGSIVDGIERYPRRKRDKRLLVDFGFVVIWFIFAFSL